MFLSKEQIDSVNASIQTIGVDTRKEQIVQDTTTMQCLSTAYHYLWYAQLAMLHEVSEVSPDATDALKAFYEQQAETRANEFDTKIKSIGEFKGKVFDKLFKYASACVNRQSQELKDMENIGRLTAKLREKGLNKINTLRATKMFTEEQIQDMMKAIESSTEAEIEAEKAKIKANLELLEAEANTPEEIDQVNESEIESALFLADSESKSSTLSLVEQANELSQ